MTTMRNNSKMPEGDDWHKIDKNGGRYQRNPKSIQKKSKEWEEREEQFKDVENRLRLEDSVRGIQSPFRKKKIDENTVKNDFRYQEEKESGKKLAEDRKEWKVPLEESKIYSEEKGRIGNCEE